MLKRIIFSLLAAAAVFMTGCSGKPIQWIERNSNNSDGELYSEEFIWNVSDKAEELGKDIIESHKGIPEGVLHICTESFDSFTAEEGSAFVVKQYRIDQDNLPFLAEIYFIEGENKTLIAEYAIGAGEYLCPLMRADDTLYFALGESIQYIDKDGKSEVLVSAVQGSDYEDYYVHMTLYEGAVENNKLNVSYFLIPHQNTDCEQQTVTYIIDHNKRAVEDISVEE